MIQHSTVSTGPALRFELDLKKVLVAPAPCMDCGVMYNVTKTEAQSRRAGTHNDSDSDSL